VSQVSIAMICYTWPLTKGEIFRMSKENILGHILIMFAQRGKNTDIKINSKK